MVGLAATRKQAKTKRGDLEEHRGDSKDHTPAEPRRRKRAVSPYYVLLATKLTPALAAAGHRARRMRRKLSEQQEEIVRVERDLLDGLVTAVEELQETGKALEQAKKLEPPKSELSPQEAAKILRMSRPSVMRLIAQKRLSFRKIGSHYKLPADEISAYAQKHARVQSKALDDLSALSQELDF